MGAWLKNRSLGNRWTILNPLGQMHIESGAHNYRNKAFLLKTQCPLAHPLNSLSLEKKKSTITFVLCWLSDVGPRAALRCGSHTQWGDVGEKQFKSSIGDNFWVRDRAGAHSVSLCWDPFWCESVQAVCAAIASVFLCAPVLLDLEGTASLMSSVSTELTVFSHPLQSSLSSKGRNLMKTYHLGLGIPRSLALWMFSSCRSLCLLPSPAGGSLSDKDWAKHSYECSRMSLGVILLPCFSRTVAFDFPLGCIAYWVSGSWLTEQCLAWVLSLVGS